MSYWWVLIGTIVLGAAIAWAMLNNKQTRGQERRTEEATRELYKDPLDHDTTRENRD